MASRPQLLTITFDPSKGTPEQIASRIVADIEAFLERQEAAAT